MNFKDGILTESSVKFVKHLIPVTNKTSRTQNKMIPKHITIHNTANPNVSALNNSKYVDTAKGYVSWHFTVGDGVVYQELPINENAWHAGDGSKGEGNRQSIAIEVAEVDGAYETAIIFVKELIAYLGFTTNDIYPHKHWSGKDCPRLILPIWDKFISQLEEKDYKALYEAAQTKLDKIKEIL